MVRKLMIVVWVMIVFLFWGVAFPGERVKLAPSTLKTEIMNMNPAEVDPSLLPLDPVYGLNVTGTPPEEVNLETWRLEVRGAKVKNPLSLSYEELLRMPMVKKRVLLICPGFFADYAEWEGVPLEVIFKEAGVEEEYRRVRFVGLDRYEALFTAEELGGEKIGLLFLAVRVNGETLPLEHGFPVRLVAEDFYGGRWVKWIREIVID